MDLLSSDVPALAARASPDHFTPPPDRQTARRLHRHHRAASFILNAEDASGPLL
jgi:hypothetical protein